MQDARTVLKDILYCGYAEVDMLLETNIDIAATVQYLTEEGLGLNIGNLYYNAFFNEVCDKLQHLPNFKESDFQIYYNGALGTNFYVKSSKMEYYWANAPEEMKEIEDIFDMEFEEAQNRKETHTLKAINIKWDTDGDLEWLYELPEEMEIPEGMTDEDEISDWLSDQEGFCHNGFELVEVGE